MTDEQKYAEVLKGLGELLFDKNMTISCQKYEIDRLKAKLEAAEAERDAATADLKIAGEELAAALGMNGGTHIG